MEPFAKRVNGFNQIYGKLVQKPQSRDWQAPHLRHVWDLAKHFYDGAFF